jgi:hypothetical protein
VYHQDASRIPWPKLSLTFATWASVLGCALLRGSSSSSSFGSSQSWLGAVSCGGGLYWAVFLLNGALLFAVTVHAREVVLARWGGGRRGERKRGRGRGGWGRATPFLRAQRCLWAPFNPALFFHSFQKI